MKDSERNLIESFRNCEVKENINQNNITSPDTPQLPYIPSQREITSKNIMKSIFYQNNDSIIDQHHNREQFSIDLRQLEFKSISADKEKKLILLEMIDMIDKFSSKKRSMVAVTMLPAESYTEDAKTQRLKEI